MGWRGWAEEATGGQAGMEGGTGRGGSLKRHRSFLIKIPH